MSMATSLYRVDLGLPELPPRFPDDDRDGVTGVIGNLEIDRQHECRRARMCEVQRIRARMHADVAGAEQVCARLYALECECSERVRGGRSRRIREKVDQNPWKLASAIGLDHASANGSAVRRRVVLESERPSARKRAAARARGRDGLTRHGLVAR